MKKDFEFYDLFLTLIILGMGISFSIFMIQMGANKNYILYNLFIISYSTISISFFLFVVEKYTGIFNTIRKKIYLFVLKKNLKNGKSN